MVRWGQAQQRSHSKSWRTQRFRSAQQQVAGAQRHANARRDGEDSGVLAESNCDEQMSCKRSMSQETNLYASHTHYVATKYTTYGKVTNGNWSCSTAKEIAADSEGEPKLAQTATRRRARGSSGATTRAAAKLHGIMHTARVAHAEWNGHSLQLQCAGCDSGGETKWHGARSAHRRAVWPQWPETFLGHDGRNQRRLGTGCKHAQCTRLRQK